MPDDNKATFLTRASFEQEHPTLFAQVRAEFLTLGATHERERIQTVLAVGDGLPGHEKLLASLAYDGKSTAADAGLAVLASEKQTRAAAVAAHQEDAPLAAKPSAPAAEGDKPTPAALAQRAVALFKKANGVK